MGDDLEARVRSLEKTNSDLNTEIQVMKNDLAYIKSTLESWNSGIGKFIFILGGGLLSALVAWIVGGGLVGK